MVEDGKRVGLVLAGGASLGLTHLGVVRALDELGYTVTGVIGVSAGAVTGALVAAALETDEIIDFHRRQDWFRVLRPALTDRLGALDYKRLDKLLEDETGYELIEELPRPYIACCTEMTTGEPRYVDHGPLGVAARASSSVPGLFTPVEIGGEMLVDGGIHTNLPLDAVDQLHPDSYDLIVASDPITNLTINPAESYRDVLQIGFILVLKSTTKKVLPPDREDVALVQPELEWTEPIDLGAIDRLIESGREETLRRLEPERLKQTTAGD